MQQDFRVKVKGFPVGADVEHWLQRQLQRHGESWITEVSAAGEAVEDDHPGPLVSILLPNYNYAHRIERMIASIRAQSVQDYELIVVDDGSTDGSINKIRSLLEPRDRLLIHGKNQGAAAAINTAAAAARGRFFTWVSSDNEMTTNWLNELVLMMSPDVGVAYANYDRFNDSGPQPGTWGKPYDPERLINDENCYIGPAFLIRADIWKVTGELRGRNSCDYDHWLRIEEACQRRNLRFAYTEKVLCHYYAGNERCTVTRRNEYDAPKWKEEARQRRGLVTA